MFLRSTRRFKDGKEHRYWSIVENRRCLGGKILQRPVLYLGEINDSQKAAWCRILQGFDETAGEPRQMALFAWDRQIPAHAAEVRRFLIQGGPIIDPTAIRRLFFAKRK
jgi:hypothetical protein